MTDRIEQQENTEMIHDTESPTLLYKFTLTLTYYDNDIV